MTESVKMGELARDILRICEDPGMIDRMGTGGKR